MGSVYGGRSSVGNGSRFKVYKLEADEDVEKRMSEQEKMHQALKEYLLFKVRSKKLSRRAQSLAK